jgi:hypothetical protein
MDSKTIIEVQNRLSDLKSRAMRAGYKCIIPKLPEFKKEKPEIHESQMLGFNKRLYNWERVLLQFEYPGGIHVNLVPNNIGGVNLIKEQ